MKDKRIHYDTYPWRLRLIHGGGGHIKIERKGRWVQIDPVERPETDAIVVLTSAVAERVQATWASAKAGVKPTVLAADALLNWVQEAGPVQALGTPALVDGLRITTLPYQALRTPPWELLRMGPAKAMRQLAGQIRLPESPPQIVEILFEDGSRLLHLDLSIHRETPSEWLDQVVSQFAEPEWLLVGQPMGEADALVQVLPRFKPRRVLVAELLNTERRRLGLPVELVTITRDRLLNAGLEAHVFAPQASYRFE